MQTPINRCSKLFSDGLIDFHQHIGSFFFLNGASWHDLHDFLACGKPMDLSFHQKEMDGSIAKRQELWKWLKTLHLSHDPSCTLAAGNKHIPGN